VENGKIVEVGENLTGGETIDLSGKRLVPGFLDLHSHGCFDGDFSLASEEKIREMCTWYARHGVTSVLATTVTNAVDTTKKAMATLGNAIAHQEEAPAGAYILGINMEGPFLGKDKKGAHDEQFLTPPIEQYYDELYELSGGNIRLTDVDPTLPGSLDFIRKNRERSYFSIAHTSCSYAQAQEAYKAGATQVTHLFNAMNGLHHREPGLIGAVCDLPLIAELICDGVHVHPAVVRMMFRLIPERIAIVSDSLSAAGVADGKYISAGLEVFVKDGKATLANGTIAGSTTNIHQEVVNLVKFGIPLEDAIRSATEIPAKAIGRDDIVGSIAPGKQADLVVLDDDLSIDSVYCRGEKI
jgi:N-acetylglucosamine-6-phosphate deacetylase